MSKIRILGLVIGTIFFLFVAYGIMTYGVDWESHRVREQKDKFTTQWTTCHNQADPFNQSACYQYYNIDWEEQTNLEKYLQHNIHSNDVPLFGMAFLSLFISFGFLMELQNTIMPFNKGEKNNE